MAVDFKKPDEDVIQHVALKMREADVNEVKYSHNHTPYDALKRSIQLSDYSTVAWINNEPCAIFGLVVSGMLSDKGSPWLLGTDGIVKNYREFLKHSKSVKDEILKISPVLVNYVHAGNAMSIKWLKWLGFTIENAKPYGYYGQLFHRFHMSNPNV